MILNTDLKNHSLWYNRWGFWAKLILFISRSYCELLQWFLTGLSINCSSPFRDELGHNFIGIRDSLSVHGYSRYPTCLCKQCRHSCNLVLLPTTAHSCIIQPRARAVEIYRISVEICTYVCTACASSVHCHVPHRCHMHTVQNVQRA